MARESQYPCILLLAFALAATTIAFSSISTALAEKPTTQATPLEGLWDLEKNYDDGEEHPLLDWQYRIRGNKAEYVSGGHVYSRFELKVDLEKDPPHFDMIGEIDGRPYIQRGVFQIEGDRLTWSHVSSSEKERPTSITKRSCSMQVLRRLPDLETGNSMEPAATSNVGSKQSTPLLAPGKFEFQLLSTTDGRKTIATDLNNLGTVLGECGEGPSKRACIWKDGQHSVLSGFDLDHAAVYAINDHDTVAGAHVFSAYARPYYELDGKLYPMEFDIKSPFALPYGMNLKRQVVGVSFLPNDITSSWLWDDGKVRSIETLGGWTNEAMAINDHGQVAGFSTLNQNRTIHAFLLTDGNAKDLGTLGGNESKAYDLNQAGQVVGYAANRNGEKRAFLWSNEKLQELPPLPTGTASWAWSINDTGWSVGWSKTSSDHQVAVVWHNSRVFALQDLARNTDGWDLDIARGVNNAGAIVGTASKNGRLSAFMLTPVHERSKAMEVE